MESRLTKERIANKKPRTLSTALWEQFQRLAGRQKQLEARLAALEVVFRAQPVVLSVA